MNDAEYQLIHIETNDTKLDLMNYYCPNDLPLKLDTIHVTETFLACGDFNSHSQSWGYDHIDHRGEEIENWQDENNLLLINHPSDAPTFYSRSWHTTSTPDLAFCTGNLHGKITRSVGDQLGGSDHRPIYLQLQGTSVHENKIPPRWNYKKANWMLYKHRTSILASQIETKDRDINNIVKDFNACILKAAKEAIPRGARRNYKPYWTSELQKLQDKVEETRKEVETKPNQQNHNFYQAAKAKFQRRKIELQRNSWKEKTKSLNFEKDGKKLWKLTKQLNDETDRGNNISLVENNDIIPGKKAADYLARQFAEVSNIQIGPEQRQNLKIENERLTTSEPPDIMTSLLTEQELSMAISKLKKHKSPGSDGITNEMIMNLGTPARKKLLEIFNISWESGEVPQVWRKAIMIPILKPGKDKTKANSYRPISLTSCICKTLERIINQRLKWYLETENIIVSEQAGFRQCHSTEDQATYLSQVIEDAFQDKKHVLTTWIDLQKAFDKVWTEGLLVKLKQNGIKGLMFKWTKAYLHNRKARVNANQQESKDVLMRHGVPQGGVLSPTLFLIYINDLIKELRGGIKAALYADDLVVWYVDESPAVATNKVQNAVEQITKWTERWCVKINQEKSSTTFFTLSGKQAGTIKIGNTPLKTDDQPTYLGVTFDRKLTWKNQLKTAETKARRKLAIMRKLCGTDWGANERILKNIYVQGVRPHMEYASSAWSSASNTGLQSLDRVQNQALRIITGGIRSTPIQQMEKITGIQPLKERRDTKIIQQAQKYLCTQDSAMKGRMKDLARGRLKRSSFVHQAKRLRKGLKDMPSNVLPLTYIPEQTPWKEPKTRIEIRKTVPGVYSIKEQNEVEKRTAAMATIEDSYPEGAWTRVYTDGSATDATHNGGAGIYIQYPNAERDSISIPTGIHCSNYEAEACAIIEAATHLAEKTPQTNQVVFLTDALSVLQASENGKLSKLTAALGQLNYLRIVLQWIPSHCRIPGNENADSLAKQGTEKAQPDRPITFQELKTIVKRKRKPPTVPPDHYHQLDRKGQTIIFRLRTRHNRLNYHMYNKFKIGNSANCGCGHGHQTTEHVLQECTQLQETRTKYWPEEHTLEEKLYGPLVELQKTVDYILDSGLTV